MRLARRLSDLVGVGGRQVNAFWYNGRLIDGEVGLSLGVGDPGLRFGATVFTTMRVYGKDLSHPLTQWVGHCDRLKNSLTHFGWSLPDWSSVREGCEHLLAHYPVLRITLFPDGREWITGRGLPADLDNLQQQGVSAWIAPGTIARSLPTHKTGNYLACWLAKSQAQDREAAEAILVNAQGDWLETSTGNLWGWKEDRWWTPETEQCLPGLMRDWLIDTLRAEGEVVETRCWDRDLVLGFGAIAYSNCVVQLLPIRTVLDGQTELNYDAQHASIRALQNRI